MKIEKKGNKFMKKNNAFTMAEILISLTIIGVIAALTLPALMANLNEKVWNTKRKALHSRMAQALAAMPNLDKYQETDDGSEAYNFINNGLATTLNITKVCDKDNTAKCDFNWPERAMNDDVIDFSPVLDLVSFNTINGESVGVVYNPDCRGESSADFMTSNGVMNMECATFFYDLNGASKGPNRFGKDMGLMTAYFPEYPLVVAPMPVAITGSEVNANEMEDLLASNSEYRLPSPAEAAAISFYGYFLRGNPDDKAMNIWTDNDIICNSVTCTKANGNAKADVSSAYLVLVSKNGDAPKTFKALEKGEGSGCSKENLSACKDEKECTGAGGFWVDQKPNGYCEGKAAAIKE